MLPKSRKARKGALSPARRRRLQKLNRLLGLGQCRGALGTARPSVGADTQLAIRVGYEKPGLDGCGVNGGSADDAFGNRVTGQAGNIVDAQFVHELLAMFFYCLDA